ncbi:MAG: hypothetical protein ACXIUD_05025 [Mongoliitalea sp.]
MKNLKLKLSLILILCFAGLVGINRSNAQESVAPPPCDDCQYKEKDVTCIRAGYENGQPYAYIGNRIKCVDGTGGCNSGNCNK